MSILWQTEVFLAFARFLCFPNYRLILLINVATVLTLIYVYQEYALELGRMVFNLIKFNIIPVTLFLLAMVVAPTLKQNRILVEVLILWVKLYYSPAPIKLTDSTKECRYELKQMIIHLNKKISNKKFVTCVKALTGHTDDNRRFIATVIVTLFALFFYIPRVPIYKRFMPWLHFGSHKPNANANRRCDQNSGECAT